MDFLYSPMAFLTSHNVLLHFFRASLRVLGVPCGHSLETCATTSSQASFLDFFVTVEL